MTHWSYPICNGHTGTQLESDGGVCDMHYRFRRGLGAELEEFFTTCSGIHLPWDRTLAHGLHYWNDLCEPWWWAFTACFCFLYPKQKRINSGNLLAGLSCNEVHCQVLFGPLIELQFWLVGSIREKRWVEVWSLLSIWYMLKEKGLPNLNEPSLLEC